MGEGLNHVV